MQDVKDLSAILGLSERQIHIRLAKLSTLLDNHIHTGKHNRKLIDDQGFAILNRVVELERDGIAVDLAVEQVKRELDNGDGIKHYRDVDRGVTAELLEELRRTIQRLERDKEFLQARLEAKEREIERLHDIIANRLPGRVDPQWAREGSQARTTEYMQQTINAQREEIERLRQELQERRPWWQRLFHKS